MTSYGCLCEKFITWYCEHISIFVTLPLLRRLK